MVDFSWRVFRYWHFFKRKYTTHLEPKWGPLPCFGGLFLPQNRGQTHSFQVQFLDMKGFGQWNQRCHDVGPRTEEWRSEPLRRVVLTWSKFNSSSSGRWLLPKEKQKLTSKTSWFEGNLPHIKIYRVLFRVPGCFTGEGVTGEPWGFRPGRLGNLREY